MRRPVNDGIGIQQALVVFEEDRQVERRSQLPERGHVGQDVGPRLVGVPQR